MLTQLRIRNFKAWQDTGNIRLAPLTVFFGTNSSGKTSLFQLLLMLKQTVQSTDRRRVLFFGDQHSLVDLGGWQDVVFRHEEQRTLGFELQWDSLGSAEAVSGQTERCAWTELRFSAEVSSPGPEHSRVVVDQLVYQAVAPGISPHVRMYRVGSDSHDTLYGISGYNITSDGTEHPPVRFYGFPRDAFALFGNAERLITDWVLQLETRVESIHYLGPIRTPPERTYIWRGTPPDDVGRFGEQTVSAMLAAREFRFRLNAEGQEAKTMEFEVIIAQWLRKMGLLESFEVRSLAPSGKEYKIIVRAAGMPEAVNLVDVGFGVSQVLPVLVQILYPKQEGDSILLFEQPELHLHPRAQSELADIFIEALQLRDEKWETYRQMLVETHSEHFLRRVQRRIAEKKLKPEDVALYFCRPGPEGSTIEELRLDEYGRIANWPESFFGDAISETEYQMEAMLSRMEEEADGHK